MEQVHPDPVLASRIRSPDTTDPVFGLVVTVLHPAPPSLLSVYGKFRSHLQSRLAASGIPESAYLLYPDDSIHCTVVTVHPFHKQIHGGPEDITKFWSNILERSTQLPGWPPVNRRTTVHLIEPRVCNDGVGVLLFNDTSGAIANMRKCLKEAFSRLEDAELQALGGISVEGVKIPNIVHSTILRWRASPHLSITQLQNLFNDAYAESVQKQEPKSIDVGNVCLLREWEPYMQKLTCCHELSLVEEADVGNSPDVHNKNGT